jgi:hypothetical protein
VIFFLNLNLRNFFSCEEIEKNIENSIIDDKNENKSEENYIEECLRQKKWKIITFFFIIMILIFLLFGQIFKPITNVIHFFVLFLFSIGFLSTLAFVSVNLIASMLQNFSEIVIEEKRPR